MAVIYLRSTDGSDADNGSTWALAKATLAAALTAAGAGGTVYVSKNHAESSAGVIDLVSPGTAASPTNVLCVDDTGNPEPPTALAATATVTNTAGGAAIQFQGHAVSDGVSYISTSAASTWIRIANANDEWIFRNGGWSLTGAGSGSSLQPNSGQSNSRTVFENWTMTFGHASQFIYVLNEIAWYGGAVAGTAPTVLFVPLSGFCGLLDCRGVDLSLLGSGSALVQVNTGRSRYVFTNCKLGSSVALTASTPSSWGGPRIRLDHCDSADTNYRMQRHQYEGDSYSETTIVRTGGASDGTTGLSHKHVSSANSKFYAPLYGPEMVIWNDATGSAQTVTCEIVHDSVTNLQDDEVWLETEYLGTSGFPLSLFANDRAANILATAADQTASSEMWTTTGLTNPNTQKLVTTHTPQEKGWYRCRVALAKPSYTIYVCPELAIDGVVVSGVQRLVPGAAYVNEHLGRGPEFRGANL